jgi:hypothetical protein
MVAIVAAAIYFAAVVFVSLTLGPLLKERGKELDDAPNTKGNPQGS